MSRESGAIHQADFRPFEVGVLLHPHFTVVSHGHSDAGQLGFSPLFLPASFSIVASRDVIRRLIKALTRLQI